MDVKQFKVELNVKTYKNDNVEGLFNFKFQSKEIKKDMFIIKNGCYIVRRNEYDIQNYEDNMEFKMENSVILFRIRESLINKCFEIINPIRENMPKKEKYINNLYYHNAWYVIRSKEKSVDNYNRDYILNENDIIKLGPKMYEIIKININIKNKEEIQNKNKLEEIQNKYNISEINKKRGAIFNINLKPSEYIIDNQNINKKEKDEEINQKECKKCGKLLSNENLIDNPLLSICLCKNYIHYKCLKEILKGNVIIKLISKNKNVIKYICENFYCNECKIHYPLRFKISEKIYELIDLINPPPKTDFIMLESLNNKQNNTKILYTVKFNNALSDEKIYIGSLEQNNKIKNDIIDDELSQVHAELKYDKKKGNIIIEDKGSTFGSSVLIKGNIKLTKEKINFQIGRSYFSANLIN